MDLQLAGKKALVSGSTAGIGYAIAAALHAEGAEVVVNGRTEARAQEAAEKIRAGKGGAVHALAADLGTAAGCALALERYPDVDILVNNVGIFEPRPFAEIGDADWNRLWEVNVLSGVRLSRHHLPRMLARNAGRIIFVSSESALQIPAEMIHYGVTKTAQLSLARGMAETTRGTAVTVNCVLPGPTWSEGVEVFVGELGKAQKKSPEQMEKEFFQHARPSSLLQRFETPEEIGSLVAFVASPLASGISGAALRVDGGVVRAVG